MGIFMFCTFLFESKIFKTRKCLYLACLGLKWKNKTTLFSSTLNVWQNKVVLFFSFWAKISKIWPFSLFQALKVQKHKFQNIIWPYLIHFSSNWKNETTSVCLTSMVYILAKNPYLFPPPTFSRPANLPWK